MNFLSQMTFGEHNGKIKRKISKDILIKATGCLALGQLLIATLPKCKYFDSLLLLNDKISNGDTPSNIILPTHGSH